jgi:predicted ArsR family transcriptional regulator
LAQENTELVCGMNLDLLTGALDELEAARLNAELEPRDDGCCVHLVRARDADSTSR